MDSCKSISYLAKLSEEHSTYQSARQIDKFG